MSCRRLCVGLFCETWGSGGIESFLLNVLPYVDRERFHIRIITVKLESDFYLQRLLKMGVELDCFSESNRSSHARFYTFYKMLHTNQYDVLHFHLFEGMALGYVQAAKAAGVPVRIVHSHNTDLRKSFFRPLKLAVHECAKFVFSDAATYRLACSRSAARFLFPAEDDITGRWVYIPNGIRAEQFSFDADKRRVMRRELGIGSELVVGCIGRLCRQKNQRFLRRAFARLHEREPRSRLVLVGEGIDEQELRKLANSFGIWNAVTFYGVSQHIPELLWAFDVLAFPSLFEGLGIVAVEAQAACLPVVCSDYIPQEAAVTDLVRFLSLEAGEEGWADALLHAKCMKRRDMRQEIHQAGYAIESTAEKLQALWAGEAYS